MGARARYGLDFQGSGSPNEQTRALTFGRHGLPDRRPKTRHFQATHKRLAAPKTRATVVRLTILPKMNYMLTRPSGFSARFFWFEMFRWYVG